MPHMAAMNKEYNMTEDNNRMGPMGLLSAKPKPYTAPNGNVIGFFGLLAIVFITLKLTNVINWSWWWVTAPLWGPFVALLGFAAVVFIVALISVMIKK